MTETVVGGAMSWPDVPTVRVGATPDLVTLGPLGQATVHCGVCVGVCVSVCVGERGLKGRRKLANMS
jgi:hypothetical protein